jgi:hypothetical protein
VVLITFDWEEGAGQLAGQEEVKQGGRRLELQISQHDLIGGQVSTLEGSKLKHQ